MTIDETYRKYLERGEFNNPDYEREDKILESFKAKNDQLSKAQESKLVEYLERDSQDWKSQYFVADLLYFYSDFSQPLMKSMLQTGVSHQDPSFNRVFLRPCVRSDKKKEAMHWLKEKLKTGILIERIGVSNLYYWLGTENVDRSELRAEIYHKSKYTDNIVELYFYQLAIGSLGFRFRQIPKDADSLIRKIKGNSPHERFLSEDLGWRIN